MGKFEVMPSCELLHNLPLNPPLLESDAVFTGESSEALLGEGKEQQTPLANFSASSLLEKALNRDPLIILTACNASFLSSYT